MTKISIIGCGFVANYYMLTLSKSKTLQVAGVLDRIQARAQRLVDHYSIPKVYDSLQELVADETVGIVLNLTNPRDHYETSRACLEAGKHVYTEKPMAMKLKDAKHLVEIAQRKGLQLSSAPCSILGEAAQTVWKAVRKGEIGQVRLVYVELDNGLIHKTHPERWQTSRLGVPVPFPAKDEFEIGCTLEHAGYYLAWLAAIFGPAKTVTAFGACLIPDKLPGIKLDPPDTPDFSVACIEFHSGTVARVTCGIVAPRNRALTLIGDEGILHVEQVFNYRTPIRIRPRKWNRDLAIRNPVKKLGVRAWRKLTWRLRNPHGRKYPLVRAMPNFDWEMGLRMDFSRGVEELAASIKERRESRLSTQFSLHIAEMALAIHEARTLNQPYRMTTTFDPPEPMPWAK